MRISLSFLDKSFWLADSASNPKHVACLQKLEMPALSVGSTYVKKLVEEVRTFATGKPPFNCTIRTFLGYPLDLQPLKSLDMDYHVQLHKVADVDDDGALNIFVATLHETRLDHTKPLWQYHFIYDDQSRRFAIYARVHHMYGDGATLVKWFQSGYLPEPKTCGFVPLWALKHLWNPDNRHKRQLRVWQRLWGNIKVGKELLIILIRLLLKIFHIFPDYMPAPFSSSQSVLTGQVQRGRTVATVDIDVNRIKRLSKLTRASANEVLLCVFDISVHRLLHEYGYGFEKALFTNMPINLREAGEQTTGNRIAIVPVQLAHGEQDPYLRLQQIIVNHRIVKRAAQDASAEAFSAYTIIIQACALLGELLRLSNWIKPIANVLVSNISGPRDARYLKDSKVLSCYPISTVTPGGGVNITLMTYAGKANIGMVCCNKNVKSLQPLADHCAKAFSALEKSVDNAELNIKNISRSVPAFSPAVVNEK